MTDVDVIVLDVDGGAMLDECLASIRAQSVAPKRILLLDNGSRVPASERVNGAEVIRSEKNLGFAGGVNAAFRHVRSELVALINNDVVLDTEWLATVLEAMRDPAVAAVQTVIRRDDATIDGAGIDIADGTFRQAAHGARLGAPLPHAWGVSATAALYRRAAFGEKIFDDSLFAYYEDVELCARLHAGRWRTVVLPVIRATHRGSSSAPLLGRDALRLRTRNRYLVARRHRGVGRIRALLWEDAKAMLRAPSLTRLRGVWEGLRG
jgi:GT2 family glycosyltransferase